MRQMEENDPYMVSDDVDVNNREITVRIPQLDVINAAPAGSAPSVRSAVESIAAWDLPVQNDG